MTEQLFNEIFDKQITPQITELEKNNPLICKKDLDTCKKQIYQEYDKLITDYKKQIFNESDSLLDRHKVAACMCGAFLKVSIFTKNQMVENIKKSRKPVEAFFYYVNELIAVYAANRYLSFFMIKDSTDSKYHGQVFKHFPEAPCLIRSEYAFWSNVVFNLSCIKDEDQIGEEHYDVYAYAMFFFMLESYFKKTYEKCA